MYAEGILLLCSEGNSNIMLDIAVPSQTTNKIVAACMTEQICSAIMTIRQLSLPCNRYSRRSWAWRIACQRDQRFDLCNILLVPVKLGVCRIQRDSPIYKLCLRYRAVVFLQCHFPEGTRHFTLDLFRVSEWWFTPANWLCFTNIPSFIFCWKKMWLRAQGFSKKRVLFRQCSLVHICMPNSRANEIDVNACHVRKR